MPNSMTHMQNFLIVTQEVFSDHGLGNMCCPQESRMPSPQRGGMEGGHGACYLAQQHCIEYCLCQ